MRPTRRKGKGALAPFLAAAAVIFQTLAAASAAEPGPPVVANLPAPGTYALHRIQRVPRAELIGPEGKVVELAAVTRGAVTALGFFYGHCADPAGCPVAWSAFEEARRQASEDPLLKSRLRLVFVSLDPGRDSPAVLRLLRDAQGGGAIPWEFLTSRSQEALAPLLSAMGQDIAVETDASGRRTGVINHMLKVFLIDPNGWVREIYTTAFLAPESLLNDARTLAMAHPEATNQ